MLAILFCNEGFSLSLIRFFSKTYLKTFIEHPAWAVHSGNVPAVASALVELGGTVKTLGRTDICAVVLASGQFMFSCNGTGRYELTRTLDTNGQFKLQIYADCSAPTIQSFEEFKTRNDARMARASECQ